MFNKYFFIYADFSHIYGYLLMIYLFFLFNNNTIFIYTDTKFYLFLFVLKKILFIIYFWENIDTEF